MLIPRLLGRLATGQFNRGDQIDMSLQLRRQVIVGEYLRVGVQVLVSDHDVYFHKRFKTGRRYYYVCTRHFFASFSIFFSISARSTMLHGAKV